MSAIQKYLAKRAVRGPWRLECRDRAGIDCAICVPALAENDTLPRTLDSLARNDSALLRRTLVLVVVNHPAGKVPEDATDENRATLALLRDEVEAPKRWPEMRLGVVDATSPGMELPSREGVGLARKIGFDAALEVLDRATSSLLISLDADTLVEPNYLEAIRAHFDSDARPWAATIGYAHPLDGEPGEQQAIVAYELHLRCHALGLRLARSPFAYHSIGSAIACTAEAYAAAGGMNRRLAGEDFYFLERLAKTGSVGRINDTTVHPAARASWRVPFGTGKRVGDHLSGDADPYRTYALATYDLLQEWLALLNDARGLPWRELRERAGEISAAVRNFLDDESFDVQWDRIAREVKTTEHYARSLRESFGAFTTLKFIHYLRDTTYRNEDLFDVARGLLERFGEETPVCAENPEDAIAYQIDLLDRLRALDLRV